MDGVCQRILDKRVGHLLGQAPADDAARTEVKHENQIGKGGFFLRANRAGPLKRAALCGR
jgi:hypothetical protein